jgi:hypothetical protein
MFLSFGKAYKRSTPEVAVRRESSMAQQPCPACGHPNRPDAESCLNCGQPLALPTQAVVPLPGGRRSSRPETLGFLTTPLSLRGIPVWVVYLFAIIGVIYALNPTAGILEILPDNLPIIGNLDEGAAFIAIWYGLVEFFEGRKYSKID